MFYEWVLRFAFTVHNFTNERICQTREFQLPNSKSERRPKKLSALQWCAPVFLAPVKNSASKIPTPPMPTTATPTPPKKSRRCSSGGAEAEARKHGFSGSLPPLAFVSFQARTQKISSQLLPHMRLFLLGNTPLSFVLAA